MVMSYTQLLERDKDRLDPRADKFIHYAVEGAHRMRRCCGIYGNIGQLTNRSWISRSAR
jgi:hypothetical protein